jgi:hypothetical protein
VNWTCVYRQDRIERIQITQRGIPMLVETLVKLRDLGATFREVECRQQARSAGHPSASHIRTMWRTLIGLLEFWWQYRLHEQPARVVPR